MTHHLEQIIDTAMKELARVDDLIKAFRTSVIAQGEDPARSNYIIHLYNRADHAIVRLRGAEKKLGIKTIDTVSR